MKILKLKCHSDDYDRGLSFMRVFARIKGNIQKISAGARRARIRKLKSS